MKRQETIAKLTKVGHKRSILENLNNATIRSIYEREQPRLEARARRLQEENARRQRLVQAAIRERKREEARRHIEFLKLEAQRKRLREIIADAKRQEEWMRRCVKVPVPPIVAHWPPATLDFGLAEFLAHAKFIHAKEGNQDAACVLRFLATGRWGAR